jgi:hypothetical protein
MLNEMRNTGGFIFIAINSLSFFLFFKSTFNFFKPNKEQEFLTLKTNSLPSLLVFEIYRSYYSLLVVSQFYYQNIFSQK